MLHDQSVLGEGESLRANSPPDCAFLCDPPDAAFYRPRWLVNCSALVPSSRRCTIASSLRANCAGDYSDSRRRLLGILGETQIPEEYSLTPPRTHAASRFCYTDGSKALDGEGIQAELSHQP